MKHLSTKIFLGYLLAIIVLTGSILYFTFRNIRSHYIETFIKDLTKINRVLQPEILAYFSDNNIPRLDPYIKSIGKAIRTRITIIDTAGVVLADSEKDPSTMENHKNRPELQQACSVGMGHSVRYSSTVLGDMLYVAMPLYDAGRLVAFTRVSLWLKQIDEIYESMQNDIIKIAVLVILLTIVGVVILSRTITSPIVQLSRASYKVASGDFDQKVYIKGSDEISELTRNFNFMTAKIKELFGQVNSQKEEFITLIKAIQDGLVVLDTEGKVMLSNSSFDSLTETENPVGKFYWEFITEPEFGKAFDEMVAKRDSFTKEIELGQRHYLCSANFIASSSKIVMLLHDISEIKKVEQIKKDFILNVSHELKTPLTAIKGFVETLEDEIEGESLHYLDIIKRHTDRLINIVQDLIILSKLEESSTKLLTSKVDIKMLIENVSKIFWQKIEDKNIELKIEIEENFPSIQVDPFRIEQVFVNLLDNALRYTDSGGINIKVKKHDDRAIIEIKDSGPGIPQKDLERIFERFYIVDKSRSRRYGGSGLGLSIVKHIIQLHNGDISVQSSPGEGTKFIISLPLSYEKPSDDSIMLL